jgi:hypothetical protein
MNKRKLSMPRKNTKTSSSNSPEEHLEAIGELLGQLKTHLTASAGTKGSYGDYLRLLEFYRETRGVEATEIIVGWVDNEQLLTERAA